MKLNYFKFQDGKVFWLPEYPEKTISYCSGKPYCCEGRRCDVLQHDDAIAQSLASAIEVAPGDMESIARLIWHQLPDNQNYIWQPEKNKVYSAECEMEIVKECRGADGKTDWRQTEFERWQCEPDWIFRQVARLKHKEDIFPAANSHDMKDDDL